MSKLDGLIRWCSPGGRLSLICVVIGLMIGALVERGVTDAELAEQQVHVETMTTALRKSNQHAMALQDSVLAGTIEGFGLRCYLVREE